MICIHLASPQQQMYEVRIQLEILLNHHVWADQEELVINKSKGSDM
jgi:hypothetical protein